MKTKYLIIGNSVAGISCIEGIREVDPIGQIVVLCDETLPNYSRPLISYYLGNKIPQEKISFRDKNFYQENSVKLLLGTRAQSINTRNKVVQCKGGRSIYFEKLLLATGGIPIIPPIEGLAKIGEGVFTFTKFSDAQKLISYIKNNRVGEAVVLGGGLIGLKCTEGLVERGLKVTIVELADRLLANTFDKEASGILEGALKGWGCHVIKEDTIAQLNKKGEKINIILKNGRKLSVKLLILAVGVRPNIELIKNTSIKCERGIIVDEFMRTSAKDIYSAGDVAQGKDYLLQKNAVIAIWPTAARMGKIAGLNMAGKKVPYQGSFIMNSVELAGIPTISFGITNPTPEENYEILSIKDTKNKVYKKIVLKNNRIVGAIFLGKIERAGIFSGLIREKINVASFKHELLSEDFGFLVLPKEYRKHMVRGEGILV